MYISKDSNYTGDSKYAKQEAYTSQLDIDVDNIIKAIQGRLNFGSGTNGNLGENIGGVWVSVLSSGTTNAEVSFSHNLGSQPMGYLIMWQDKAGNLYANPSGSGINTTWTSSTVYFKSDVASGNFMVFLLARGGQG